MLKTVYLAGNIVGLTYKQASEWRIYAAKRLDEFSILDPMRGMQSYDTGEVLGVNSVLPGGGSSETFDRCLNDVENCDIVLAYMPFIGIGTTYEIAYGFYLNKGVVIVTSEELVKHPFLVESSDLVTTDLEKALDYINLHM